MRRKGLAHDMRNKIVRDKTRCIMKNDGFSYLAEVEWAGGYRGKLKCPDAATVEVSPPAEFGGPGREWTPEGLYVGAVASCFMMTFLAFALHSKLGIASATVSAEGKLEKDPDGGYRFTEVIIRPVIVVEGFRETERAERLLKKAEQSCFIASSVKSRITMSAQVYHKQAPACPCPTLSEAGAAV